MTNDTNIKSSVSVTGEITVTITMKGSKRRYSHPDIKACLNIAFGASVDQIEPELDAELALVKERILVACGRKSLDE